MKKQPHWVTGWLETPVGKIPAVSTKLKARDILGFWRMRWRIGRMNYGVEPGLYAIGRPNSSSPVLASSNYKMSFDILRRAVSGNDLWILVLDTKGINVWCAAGKGTFCAEEILQRAKLSGLQRIISDGVMVLPQLCATGVRAYELRKHLGLRVIYGPVRAADLPAFLEAGMKATPEMRRVKFNFVDRLVLTPAEFVWSLKWIILVLAILFLLGGFHRSGFSAFQAFEVGISGSVALLGAVIAGSVVTPVLLPWIPGYAFSLKGLQIGLIWALALIVYRGYTLIPAQAINVPEMISLFSLIPAASAFFALNFTGSTTFTSISGVRRELRYALPLIIGCAIIGSVVYIIDLVITKII